MSPGPRPRPARLGGRSGPDWSEPGRRRRTGRPPVGGDESGRARSRRRAESSLRAGQDRLQFFTHASASGIIGRSSWQHADVAQLVEHHLAKVRVAGSNPVVRSEVPEAVSRADGQHGSAVLGPALRGRACGGMAEWLRQGPAKPCTRVRFPLPPLRAVSSAGEHFPDTEGVTSSNPCTAHAAPQVTGRSSNPKTGLLDACQRLSSGRAGARSTDQSSRTPSGSALRLAWRRSWTGRAGPAAG